MASLEHFADEERDPAWAADIENRLEGFVARGENSAFEVRTVECRTTRCVMEVEALEQYMMGEIERDSFPNAGLYRGIGDLGLENKPDGERIVVTLLTFERK